MASINAPRCASGERGCWTRQRQCGGDDLLGVAGTTRRKELPLAPFGAHASAMPISNGPALIVLTRTLVAYSRLKDTVKALSAALAATYVTTPGSAISAQVELMLMIAPPSPCANRCPIWLAGRKGPLN